MALRGKKPTAVIKKRFKVLWYGPAGVGKTIQALQFPRPYLIDTERGAENEQYVKALESAGGAYMFTNDPDTLIEEIRSLISEEHPYKTLIIDPLTVIYNDLLDTWSQRLATADDPTGTSFSRHKQPADRKIKHLLSLMMRLDMNLIITSHEKAKWEKDGSGKPVETGKTYDAYSKLDYVFDLVMQVERRGNERVARIVKSRIESFPYLDTIPFSYDEIANRYGRDVLERDAVAVALATKEQSALLRALLGERKNGEDILSKILEKEGATEIEELPADYVGKCIAKLQGITAAIEPPAAEQPTVELASSGGDFTNVVKDDAPAKRAKKSKDAEQTDAAA